MHHSIVDDLCAAARAHRPEKMDTRCDRIENRSGFRKIFFRAADEKRILAGRHRLHATGDCCIDKADAGVTADGRQFARDFRCDRAGLDDRLHARLRVGNCRHDFA